MTNELTQSSPDHARNTRTVELAIAWLLAVSAILVPEQYLGLRAVGWAFIAFRICKHPLEGLLLLAFFTPLFENMGIIPIGFALKPLAESSQNSMSSSLVFFSIKPVQLITLLLIGSLSWRKKLFFKDPLDWLVVASLIGILAISLFSGARSEDPLKAFRVSFNFAMLIILCKVLMSMIDRKELFVELLHYYFGGIVFLCIVNTINYFSTWSLFGIECVRFNNHFSFLLSMSFPLGLFLLFTAREGRAKAGYLAILLLSFFCIVLTLSRAAMYSAAIGIMLFIALAWMLSAAENKRQILKKAAMGFFALALPAIVYEIIMGGNKALSLFSGTFSGEGKLSSFFRLFNLAYWKHSIFEDPNGGMFGERFVQLHYVKELFLAHWAFGEGWTNRVISFHGLFYTMLTGTGIIGFALFLCFLFWTFRTLFKTICRNEDAAFRLLGIALFCALCDWMLHCLLETYFLQFHIWLALALVLAYIKLTPHAPDAGHA